MKAVVYAGPKKMEVREVDDPKIEEPADLIVRVTSAAICGSDLHMYEGRTEVPEGTIFGHEIMGVIEEVGDSVKQLEKGDRVVLPFNIACGKCFNCARGYTNACLYLNPDAAGAAYGYAGMGPYAGGQAELVRVPYGDFNALKLPGKPGDDNEDDFLMLADIFPTAWHANELAHVGMGHSVAIYGAGPVGLLSVLSAKMRGAGPIFVIDAHDDRLELAKQFGGTPINYTKENPKAVISEMAQQMASLADRPGEDKMRGVLCGIDAVGYQAHDMADPETEKHQQVIDQLADIVEPTGHLGLIGVYMPEDPGANNDMAKQGIYPIPLGLIWNKGLTIGTGQCPVKQYDVFLRQTIMTGAAEPGKIASHHISIDEAPEFYEKFDHREPGVTKVVINPGK